jgi:hypothetical protein
MCFGLRTTFLSKGSILYNLSAHLLTRKAGVSAKALLTQAANHAMARMLLFKTIVLLVVYCTGIFFLSFALVSCVGCLMPVRLLPRIMPSIFREQSSFIVE